MRSHNNYQFPLVKAPLRCFLPVFLLILVACPVSAMDRAIVDLSHFKSKLTVSCNARLAAGSTAAPEELLEWCVKACEVHGYDHEGSYSLDYVSDFTVPPRLARSLWPWARKITPSHCLPYQLVIKKPVSNEKCMKYRQRVTVKGLLAIYGGWGLTLKDPSPGCIRADPRNPCRMPGAGNLNGLMLVMPEADQRRLEGRIGEQVVFSGVLELRVKGHSYVTNLEDVKLLDFKVAPD